MYDDTTSNRANSYFTFYWIDLDLKWWLFIVLRSSFSFSHMYLYMYACMYILILPCYFSSLSFLMFNKKYTPVQAVLAFSVYEVHDLLECGWKAEHFKKQFQWDCTCDIPMLSVISKYHCYFLCPQNALMFYVKRKFIQRSYHAHS